MSLLANADTARAAARQGSGWAARLGLLLAVPVLAALALAALWPGLLADPAGLRPDPASVLLPPGAEHWLGTDLSGRDLFTRIVHGAGLTLSLGLRVVVVAAAIGLLFGLLAGLAPRWVDAALSRLTEVLLAFPELLIALVVVAVLGRGPDSVAIGVTLAVLPAYLRLGRMHALQARTAGHLEAARVLGVPAWRIALRHAAPELARPLAVIAVLGVGTAITTGAALTFLGLGMEASVPEWGVIMQEGRNRLHDAWWVTGGAGLALLGTVLAITALGRALQRRLDGAAGAAPRLGSGSRLRAAVGAEARGGVLPSAQGEPGGSAAAAPGAAAPGAAAPALAVQGLQISIGGRRLVDGVDLTVAPGECLALVGPSGSGKSLTARALLGLLPPSAAWSAEVLRIDGAELGGPGGGSGNRPGTGSGSGPGSGPGEAEWRRLRGRVLALIPQEALSALDPLRRIGDEVAEPLRVHRLARSRAEARARAVELLAEAGMPEPELRARQHPHELSGGQRQRAVVATALAAEPMLLIADEPTTALDPVLRAELLAAIAARRAAGLGVLLISHDLGTARRIADRIAVLDRGRVVETGPTAAVLDAPRHAVTRGLLAAEAGASLRVEGGAEGGDGRGRERGVLEASGLGRRHRLPQGARRTVLEGVDLVLRPGRVLGVVGGSGAGKTTLARLLLGLETPDAGEVRLDGEPWSAAAERERRPRRHRLQLIAQDPLAVLHPRWSAARSIAEAIDAAPAGRRLAPAARRARVLELLTRVGLDAEHAARRPAQLSGGQRQRVAIARALAARPAVLVADEPIAALDPPAQAGILELLARLRDDEGLALVLISHDLAAVERIADALLVLDHGRVVEQGAAAAIWAAPRHPVTRRLIAAAR